MRKIADCRDQPSVSGCTLTMHGEEEELVEAATEHAVIHHGHEDTPKLREDIRRSLKDETTPAYGTVMIGRLRGSRQELEAALREWEETRPVAGYVRSSLLHADDGATVVDAVFFRSREDYQRLADDPVQDVWWRTRVAPLLDGEPTWIDGEWLHSDAPPPVVPTQPVRDARPTGGAARRR